MDSQMQAEWLKSFVAGLSARGYVDGRNVVIDYRWAEGRFDRLPGLAAEMVALKPDVIVTAAPPAIRAAQQATTTIPIVAHVHDPIGLGFVASLGRPAGNITGIAFQDSELSAKRLDLLRQAVPNLTRVAIIWNQEGGGTAAVRSVEDAARSMGLQVLALEVRETGDFAKAIDSAKSWGAQALIQMASPFITRNRRILLDLLASNRVPASCEMRRYVAEGCLMSYGASMTAMFGRLAHFVDAILKGAQAGDLPVEQPREFELVINQSTAQSLGLALPSSLTLQATGLIR
jgi:putative ABC transport system substrate-binding protein